MGVDVKKIKKKVTRQRRKNKEREERRKSYQSSWFQPEEGQNCIGICPPHENMEDLPYVERGVHRGCGPESKIQFNCRRNNEDTPISECPQCEDVMALFSSKKETKVAKAKKRRRQQRYYFPVIDMHPLIDDPGTKIPATYLQYSEDKKLIKARKCGKCDWIEGCKKGMMVMSCGTTIWDPFWVALMAGGFLVLGAWIWVRTE